MSKLAAVVNWLWKSASAFPERSVTACVTITEIVRRRRHARLDSTSVRLSEETLGEKLNRLPLANRATLL